MYGVPDTLSQLYQVITNTLDVCKKWPQNDAVQKNIILIYLSHSFLGVLVEEVSYVGLFF